MTAHPRPAIFAGLLFPETVTGCPGRVWYTVEPMGLGGQSCMDLAGTCPCSADLHPIQGHYKELSQVVYRPWYAYNTISVLGADYTGHTVWELGMYRARITGYYALS